MNRAAQLCRATASLLVLWAATAVYGQTGQASETVVLSAGGDRQVRLLGEILDLTGAQLVFRHASGREETIDASRVVEVDSDWSQELRDAEVHYRQRDYATALAGYQGALAAESRVWVKRRILARLVWCHRSMGQLERAGDVFLALYRSDPATRDLDALPLAWIAFQPSLSQQRRAQQWLGSDQPPVARLIAASWLLSTSERSGAIGTLQQLLNEEDPRVIFLAEAQLWRTRLAAAAEEEVGRWQARLEQMPRQIRAGPTFLLAQGLARHGASESAALAYLQIPILYPQQRQLAARSLLAAARELETIDQLEEARGLLREVILEYADQSAAGEARQRLEQLE